MIKSTRDISQNVIKAINDNSEKIINILTSIKVNINNPMNNNNITYNNWCDKKCQDIDAKEKKSIFLSNINRNAKKFCFYPSLYKIIKFQGIFIIY